MDDALFLICSTVEAFSIFTIMLSLFRFNVFHYYKQLIAISILMSVLSFSIWNELNLSDFAPLISIAIFIVFIFYTLRISIVGSIIVAISGYISYALIQTVILLLMESANVFSLVHASKDDGGAYILQVVSSIIALSLSWMFYRRGLGFTFSLDRFKWRKEIENTFMFAVLALGIIFVASIPMFKNSLFIAAAILIIVLFFLIFLSMKKEKR